ncbi:MAG: nucleotide exchange factor GrpE [Methanoregula sp.]|jgi:molecular chaperone GrpE (heat shock protein)|uniref:nucleotide exchange factor GrpE n=1 Tax=Methanoregula sp. TaxID=2052170 RepID=UPI0025FA0D46|nr:nucleotide exchange factor GrpE [Methanoregula sp.]MCK9631962.1 nucleotide exchange factor GrpE [Methanoregula sp.]
MTEQGSSQEDLTDAEILPDKKGGFPENEILDSPPRDNINPDTTTGSPSPISGSGTHQAPDVKPDHEFSCQTPGSEEKLLGQIQKLQQALAESARREEELVHLVNEQNRLFKVRFSQDEQKEKMIDKMHEELQKLKSDLYKNLVRPVLGDVLRIRDNMRRMETDLNKKYPDGMVPIKIFSDYSLDLADLLEDHGVEIFEEKAGTPFIPIKQKVITRVATGNKELTGIISRTICSGYIYNGQVISPQKVDVYYFEEPKQNVDPGDETTQPN